MAVEERGGGCGRHRRQWWKGAAVAAGKHRVEREQAREGETAKLELRCPY